MRVTEINFSFFWYTCYVCLHFHAIVTLYTLYFITALGLQLIFPMKCKHQQRTEKAAVSAPRAGSSVHMQTQSRGGRQARTSEGHSSGSLPDGAIAPEGQEHTPGK